MIVDVCYYKYGQLAPANKEKMMRKTCITFTVSHLATKCHNAIKKCHNVTEKCHTMTFGNSEFLKKMQPQSAGYVKVKLIADPLT